MGESSNDIHSENPLKGKRKRNVAGTPDPNLEVIALSPETLLASHRFTCEICHKGFPREQNLHLHKRSHNINYELKKGTLQGEIRKRVYVCPVATCIYHHPSRALSDITGIKKHFSRKHGEKNLKCEKCPKFFAIDCDRKAHSKKCGIPEYQCDCGTTFSRKNSFNAHREFCATLSQESARISASPLTHPVPPPAQHPFYHRQTPPPPPAQHPFHLHAPSPLPNQHPFHRQAPSPLPNQHPFHRQAPSLPPVQHPFPHQAPLPPPAQHPFHQQAPPPPPAHHPFYRQASPPSPARRPIYRQAPPPLPVDLWAFHLNRQTLPPQFPFPPLRHHQNRLSSLNPNPMWNPHTPNPVWGLSATNPGLSRFSTAIFQNSGPAGSYREDHVGSSDFGRQLSQGNMTTFDFLGLGMGDFTNGA